MENYPENFLYPHNYIDPRGYEDFNMTYGNPYEEERDKKDETIPKNCRFSFGMFVFGFVLGVLCGHKFKN